MSKYNHDINFKYCFHSYVMHNEICNFYDFKIYINFDTRKSANSKNIKNVNRITKFLPSLLLLALHIF